MKNLQFRHIFGVIICGVVVVLLGAVKLDFIFAKNVAKQQLDAEIFINNHLYERNGLIKTDLLKQSNIYLSESIGLWLQYLLKKNDQKEFHTQFNVLKKYFMKNSVLLPWRIVNKENAEANAVIDDLRVIYALYEAGEKWNEEMYTNLAQQMSEEILQYNVQNGVFVNHVDIENKYAGDFLTMSYIVPFALDYMHANSLLTEELYILNKNVLINAPLSPSGFFPKTYYLSQNRYEYDSEINLIDQYYVGYHKSLWGGDVTSLIQFTDEMLIKHDGVLYGRFSNKTREPVVEFEAPAVYALAILMCLEVNENELASKLYKRMKEFQVHDESNEYFGGYIDIPSLDTHAFDNLLPLIAERRGKDEGVF